MPTVVAVSVSLCLSQLTDHSRQRPGPHPPYTRTVCAQRDQAVQAAGDFRDENKSSQETRVCGRHQRRSSSLRLETDARNHADRRHGALYTLTAAVAKICKSHVAPESQTVSSLARQLSLDAIGRLLRRALRAIFTPSQWRL